MASKSFRMRITQHNCTVLQNRYRKPWPRHLLKFPLIITTLKNFSQRKQSEANLPLFGTSNAYYNKPFDMRELDYALSRTKDTSPGEDGVTYKMLGNVPFHAKKTPTKNV